MLHPGSHLTPQRVCDVWNVSQRQSKPLVGTCHVNHQPGGFGRSGLIQFVKIALSQILIPILFYRHSFLLYFLLPFFNLDLRLELRNIMIMKIYCKFL